MRVMCSHGRHRVDALRGVRGGTGHHRSGRHQRRGGERGRPAGRRRARVRPRHRVVCHQRRPRRLPYRRAACGCLSPRDPAARGPAVHQRSGGCARRAERHGGHHAAQGGERPANGHRDRAGLPAARGGEELRLPGGAAADPQERRGPAGRVALRAGPAGRGDRHGRFPQRHHRPRRQPPREPVRRRQRRDSQHQRLREFRVGWRHGQSARRRADTGCDVPHRRLPRALHQPHVERAAGDPARGQSAEVRRLGDARLRRRRRDSRRTHQYWEESGAGSWVVSARRSFLDLFTKDVGFGGVPVLYSFNAKAVYDLTPRTASGWSTSRASTRFGWASATPATSKTRLPTSTSATTAGAAPPASIGNGPSGRAAWACWGSPTPRPR